MANHIIAMCSLLIPVSTQILSNILRGKQYSSYAVPNFFLAVHSLRAAHRWSKPLSRENRSKVAVIRKGHWVAVGCVAASRVARNVTPHSGATSSCAVHGV